MLFQRPVRRGYFGAIVNIYDPRAGNNDSTLENIQVRFDPPAGFKGPDQRMAEEGS
jgi:hypothetical protein